MFVLSKMSEAGYYGVPDCFAGADPDAAEESCGCAGEGHCSMVLHEEDLLHWYGSGCGEEVAQLARRKYLYFRPIRFAAFAKDALEHMQVAYGYEDVVLSPSIVLVVAFHIEDMLGRNANRLGLKQFRELNGMARVELHIAKYGSVTSV